MSTNPQSLRDLGAYWVAQGGVNLGVVGNDKHCGGYHLGRDRIFGACACRPKGICEPGKGDDDYSVQHARDRAGLTNAASAIDLGMLGGTLDGLYRFSEWLVARCQAKAPGTEDIREVIYWSVANGRVQRYSGIDGVIRWGAGQGDLSHKTHTHISFFRDSEARDKRPLFIPFFTSLPDTSTGEDMIIVTRVPFDPPRRFVVPAGTTLRGYRVERPNTVVLERTFSTGSSAAASAQVHVAYPDNPNPPVPRGGPFLLVYNGLFAGLLIVASQVRLDDPPATDCAPAIAAALADLEAKHAGEIAASSALAYNQGLDAAAAAIKDIARR